MDNIIVDALQSGYAKLLQKDGMVYLGVDIRAILDGKAIVRIQNGVVVQEKELLNEVSTSITPPVVVVTTSAIKAIYDRLGMSEQTLHEEVYEYLQTVAEMWGSGNKTATAVTGSLIGKVSKRFTHLNERLFSAVGSENRDTYLKELIKCNMPLLNELWDNKSK